MRTCKIMDFADLANHRIKLKESEKKDKCLDLARELKKNYGTWRWQLYQSWVVLLLQSPKDYQRDWKTWRQGDEWDYLNYNIIKNGQNTEKSPGGLKRLAVTQTPVKNHQLKLIWKTLKE